MKLEPKYKPNARFDMSSATDIMFLLLIFFMISLASTQSRSIKVNLPASNTTDTAIKYICLNITSDRLFFLEQDRLEDPTNLREALEKATHGKQYTTLLISADKSVPVEYIIQAADAASSLGLKIMIATTAPKISKT